MGSLGDFFGLPKDGCEVRLIDEIRGNGMFATKSFEKGDIIFREKPLVSFQQSYNRQEAWTCAYCGRFLGSLDQQLARHLGLTRLKISSNIHLPNSEGFQTTSAEPVSCIGIYHHLLCVGQIGSTSHPLYQFKQHALANNELFILAAQLIARMLSLWLENGKQGNVTAFQAQFLGKYTHKYWWEMPHDDASPEELQRLAQESITLLQHAFTLSFADTKQDLAQIAPLFEFEFYSKLLALLETNEIAIGVTSPLERYRKQLDNLQPSDKATAETILTPIMNKLKQMHEDECEDADDTEMATEEDEDEEEEATDEDEYDDEIPIFSNYEGIGMFPFTAMMNHSCEPNCQVDFEDDFTLKITVLAPIKSGDQIVQSYIFEGAPLKERQDELSSYGFVCDCPKCTRQTAAQLAPKAPKAPTKDKQKRVIKKRPRRRNSSSRGYDMYNEYSRKTMENNTTPPWLLVQNVGKWKFNGSNWTLDGHQNIGHTNIASEAQLVTRAVPETRIYPPLFLRQGLYEEFSNNGGSEPNTLHKIFRLHSTIILEENIDFEFITVIVRLGEQKDPLYHTWTPPFRGPHLKHDFILSTPWIDDFAPELSLGKTQVIWGEVSQTVAQPLEVVCTSLDTAFEAKWTKTTTNNRITQGYWEVYFSCCNSSPHSVYLDSLLYKGGTEDPFSQVKLDLILKPAALIRYGTRVAGEEDSIPNITVEWLHNVVVDAHDTVRRTFTTPLPTMPTISLIINANCNFANGVTIDLKNSGSATLVVNCIRAAGIPSGALIRVPKSNSITLEYDPTHYIFIPRELCMKAGEQVKFSVIIECSGTSESEHITFTPMVSHAHADRSKVLEMKSTSVALNLTGNSLVHKRGTKQEGLRIKEE